MSTTIDNRVVEMQFDNAQFERGVQTSIKSLEELKKGLELDKASASLSNLEKAANKFDLSTIEDAVVSLQQRFSMLGIIGMTALENITNRAVNAGVQLVKSLSIDQIGLGMSKYEAETSSIATMRYAIDGGTTAEGTERIYSAIEKLQLYSDETSYSFSTMVDNMGKFVSAGVKLEDAERSMEGIANWAAKSGTSAQSGNFARVMYNLSQAMGQGQVKLMDWMSIENANMATMDFKKQVLETAVAVGTLTKKGDKYYTKASKGNKSVEVTAEAMRETLSKGWFTADVLTEVLGKYADRTTEFGHEAFLAAQQARTFTDAIEAAKDAVSTGWARSFRIIFGDIDKATTLFTDMANGIIEVVDTVQEFRNSILEAWAANKGRENLIQAFANIWHMLQAIAYEVANAFGWLTNGIVDQYGEKLADLSLKFREATDAALGFFNRKVIKGNAGATTKTIQGITSGLEDVTQWSTEAESSVRGMISDSMRPETVEQWTAAADAIKDLNEYVAGGAVEADVLAEKIENVSSLLTGLQGTRGLRKGKQTALSGLITTLGDLSKVERETGAVTTSTSEDAEEAEDTIVRFSWKLRPVIQGMVNLLGIFKDVAAVAAEKFMAFAGQFTPLLKPALEVAGAVGNLVTHIRETGAVSQMVGGWLDEIAYAFSPITDKIQTVIGWFDTLKSVLSSRDYKLPEELDIKRNGPLAFLVGPAGEKIRNIAAGFQSLGNILVRSLSASIRSGASFISTFIMPLVGPVASMALDFLSGISTLLQGLDKGLLSSESVSAAVDGITGFFNTVRDLIVNNPIIERAKTIVSSFFKIFSKDPKAALNYLKAVGRGLLAPIKNSKLYQSASSTIQSFAAGIQATFRNSKTLKRAGAFAKSFFKAFKTDPVKATKALFQFGKNLIMSSGPVKALTKFADKAKSFLGGLFPQDATRKAQKRMQNFGRLVKDTFEKKGIGGVLDLAKQQIAKKFRSLAEAFSNSPIGKKLTELRERISGAWKRIVSAIEQSSVYQRIKGFMDKLRTAFDEGGIGGVIELLKNTIVNKFNALKTAFLQNGIVQAAINLKNRFGAALKNFAERVNLSEKIERFKEWLGELKTTFLDKGPIAALTSLKNTLKNKFATFVSGFSLRSIVDKIREWGGSLRDAFAEVDVVSALTDLRDKIVEKIRSLFPAPGEVLEEEGEEQAGEDLFTKIKDRILAFFARIGDIFSSGKEGLAKIIDGITGKLLTGLAIFLGAKIVLTITHFFNSIANINDRLSGKAKQAESTLPNVAKLLLSLAVAIGVLAAALIIMSKMDTGALLASAGILVGSFAAIAGIAFAAQKLKLEKAIKTIAEVGFSMLALAGAIVVLTLAIAILNKVEWSTLADGGLKVLVIMAAIGLFIVAMNKLGGSGFEGNWKPILAIAAAVLILTFAVKALTGLVKEDPQAVAGAVTAVSVLMLALGTGILLINKFASDATVKSVLQVLAIALAVNMLVGAVKKIAKLKPADSIRGLVMVGLLMGAIFLLSKFGGTKDVTQLGSVILSAIAVAGLLWLFTESMKKVANVPWQTMIAFAGSFAIFIVSLSAALALMSAIPLTGVLKASVGLAVAIVAIGAALAIIARVGGDAAQAVSGNLWVIGSKLSGYSQLVSNLDIDKIKASFGVLKDFAATALAVFDTPSLDEFRAQLIAVGADLSLYNTSVASLDEEKLNASLAFVRNFSSMAADIASADYTALADFGSTMQRFGANLRLYSLLTQGIDNTNSESVKSIAGDIGSIYGDLKDVTDVGDLTTAITNIGAALRLYYSEVSDITPGENEPDLSNLQKIFTDLASAMPSGETITSISGYAAGGENDMTQFALGLTAIGTALKNLGTDISGITTESVKPVMDLVGILTTLNNSLKPEKVSMDFLGIFHKETESGEADLASFSEDIVTLGTAIKDYSDQVQDVTSEKIQTSLDALDFFTKLREKLGEGSGFALDFLGVFSGKTDDITSFSTDIVLVGDALKNYAESVTGIGDISGSISSLRLLVALNNTLPNTGGLVSWIEGEKSLSTFGSDLSTLGDGLAQYADKIKGKDFSNVEKSTAPLSALADVQAKMENSGGLNQIFTGVKSLGTFASDLGDLGKGVAAYADAVKGHSFKDCEASSVVLMSLSDVSNNLQKAGGIFSSLAGLGSLKVETMQQLGQAVAAFADNTAGHDYGSTYAASRVLNSIMALNNELEFPAYSLTSFSGDIESLGDALTAFGGQAPDYENIDKMLTTLSSIMNLATGASGLKKNTGDIRGMMEEFIRDPWGADSIATMAGKAAGDFWAAFYEALNSQNGSYYASPTITPVYDMSNLNGASGAVNGQLQNTLDTTGASIQASAITDAINSMHGGLGAKLDLVNSYLASIINDNTAHATATHNDIIALNNTAASVGEAVSSISDLQVYLDGTTLVNYVNAHLV